MKTFAHVLYTWLLANGILSSGWLIIELTGYPYHKIAEVFTAQLVVLELLVLLVSLPSFLVSLAFINTIIASDCSAGEKLLFWYLATVCTAALNIIIPSVLIAGNLSLISNRGFQMIVLPIIASVLLSVTIRYQYFFKLNKVYLQLKQS